MAGGEGGSIRDAARGLEASLIRRMLQAMEKAQLENGLLGSSPSGKSFAATFDMLISEALAEKEPLGLARQIEEQLAAEGGETAAQATLASAPDWSDLFQWGAQEAPPPADE